MSDSIRAHSVGSRLSSHPRLRFSSPQRSRSILERISLNAGIKSSPSSHGSGVGVVADMPGYLKRAVAAGAPGVNYGLENPLAVEVSVLFEQLAVLPPGGVRAARR